MSEKKKVLSNFQNKIKTKDAITKATELDYLPALLKEAMSTDRPVRKLGFRITGGILQDKTRIFRITSPTGGEYTYTEKTDELEKIGDDEDLQAVETEAETTEEEGLGGDEDA